ncbi:hypothetical protein [Streptomyces sp. NWU339]|uniref:hypothetical protein n=1 Tax=Streptomyces sp. NWU339 TaxID=2185284 RepID=UPI0015E7F467|nr:hypothetical protein [Streptomyces sp. NWU339]
MFIQTMEGNGASLAAQSKTATTTPSYRDYRYLPEVIRSLRGVGRDATHVLSLLSRSR